MRLVVGLMLTAKAVISAGAHSDTWIGSAQRPRQVVVLGMHHSGASIVTKLLRDAGFYLGEDSELLWSRSNPLKFFERLDVLELNRLILRDSAAAHNHLHSRVPHWLHAGADLQAIHAGSATLRAKSQVEMARIVSSLDGPTGTRPWATKDPRLSLTAPLWMRELKAPLCLIVTREGLLLGESVVANFRRKPEKNTPPLFAARAPPPPPSLLTQRTTDNSKL